MIPQRAEAPDEQQEFRPEPTCRGLQGQTRFAGRLCEDRFEQRCSWDQLIQQAGLK